MSTSSDNFMTEDVYVNCVEFLKKEKTKFEKVVLDEFFLNKRQNMFLPITFENGYKFKTVDFIEDTSGVVVGQSGAGKTYFIRNVIKQWAMTTNPDELQLIVFDRHNLSGMKGVESLPHVLGVESDVAKLDSILDGLLDECLKREEALKEHVGSNDIPSVKGYNKKNEDKIPNIVFIVDDLTRVLGDLVEDNNELYRSLKGCQQLIKKS